MRTTERYANKNRFREVESFFESHYKWMMERSTREWWTIWWLRVLLPHSLLLLVAWIFMFDVRNRFLQSATFFSGPFKTSTRLRCNLLSMSSRLFHRRRFHFFFFSFLLPFLGVCYSKLSNNKKKKWSEVRLELVKEKKNGQNDTEYRAFGHDASEHKQ